MKKGRPVWGAAPIGPIVLTSWPLVRRSIDLVPSVAMAVDLNRALAAITRERLRNGREAKADDGGTDVGQRGRGVDLPTGPDIAVPILNRCNSRHF